MCDLLAADHRPSAWLLGRLPDAPPPRCWWGVVRDRLSCFTASPENMRMATMASYLSVSICTSLRNAFSAPSFKHDPLTSTLHTALAPAAEAATPAVHVLANVLSTVTRSSNCLRRAISSVSHLLPARKSRCKPGSRAAVRIVAKLRCPSRSVEFFPPPQR